MPDVARKYAEAGARYLFDRHSFHPVFPDVLVAPRDIARTIWEDTFADRSVLLPDGHELPMSSYYPPEGASAAGVEEDGWELWAVLGDGWLGMTRDEWDSPAELSSPQIRRLFELGRLWEDVLSEMDGKSFDSPIAHRPGTPAEAQRYIRSTLSGIGNAIKAWDVISEWLG